MNGLDWMFLLMAAPFVGSFLSVVATRLPAGRPVVLGRSVCQQCSHRLAPRDLVPILSWIVQRRRCRYCATPISGFYPLMEIGALLVAISATLVFSGWLLWVSCGFGWSLLAIAAIDYRHMIVPDELTLPLIPAGLGVAYFVDPSEVAGHIFGAGAGFVAFCIIAWVYRRLRSREGLGMGDAKLLAASGAWVAISGLASVVFLGSVLALSGVLGACCLGWRASAYDPLPFGTYLCLGTWLVWLIGPVLLPGG